jgi:hypothetical protein
MGVDRNGSTVMRHLMKHLKRDPDYFDGVVHVGDFAYDMEEREGVQGDLFMRQIEPIAARLPYMTSMGNHKKERRKESVVNKRSARWGMIKGCR